MAQDWAKRFYKSKDWAKARELAMIRDRYLCQKCDEPAEEVHHKIHLTKDNIVDPSISLNLDNLICLCYRCHKEQHIWDRANGHRKNKKPEIKGMSEYIIAEDGTIHPPV